MAEDGDEILEDIPEEQEDEERPQSLPKRKKPCNQRIDELAMPSKRFFLALYNDHAKNFPKEKMDNLKVLLQQLYAMTPEESMKYFEQQRAEAQANKKRQRLKHMVRCYLQKMRWKKQKECGLKICKKIIKKGIMYAIETPMPPIVSERLRILSDIVLEHLAMIMNVAVPDRLNADKVENILVALADWTAILIERLIFVVYQSRVDHICPASCNASQPKDKYSINMKTFTQAYDSQYFMAPQGQDTLPRRNFQSPRPSKLSKIEEMKPASSPRQSIVSKEASKVSSLKGKSASRTIRH